MCWHTMQSTVPTFALIQWSLLLNLGTISVNNTYLITCFVDFSLLLDQISQLEVLCHQTAWHKESCRPARQQFKLNSWHMSVFSRGEPGNLSASNSEINQFSWFFCVINFHSIIPSNLSVPCFFCCC